MNKLFCVLLGCFVLSACSHAVPVTSTFPDVPDPLKVECEKLKLLSEGAKLSDVMITITENYMKYHECSVKVEGWNDWYNKQKKIFEDATK